MLEQLAPDIWHVQHRFSALGLPVSSRMTIVRLASGELWLHSPVPLSQSDRQAVNALGTVAYIVAPSKTHHLFINDCLALFPGARVFGAPGLAKKRPDLRAMVTLGPAPEPEWQGDFDQALFEGIPVGNEVVWYHKQTRTLILTDLCQWWQGDLPLSARAYAWLTGVRKAVAVPLTVRLAVKDRRAARASAERILQWPFERVIMAHNSVLGPDAGSAARDALKVFLR